MARQIELKQLSIVKKGEPDAPFNYKDTLELILKAPTPGQQGFSLDDIRKCNKIQDQLDAAKDVVVLEEAEYNYIKTKVTGFRWGMPHKVIEDFCDDVFNAQKVKLNG